MLGSLPSPGGSMDKRRSSLACSSACHDARACLLISPAISRHGQPFPRCSRSGDAPVRHIRPLLRPSTVGATARPPKSTSTLGSQLPNGGVGICRGGGGRRLGGSEGEGGDDMQDSESPSQGKAGQEERRRSGLARSLTLRGGRTLAPLVEARLHALRRERGRRRHASRRPARKAARQAEATCDAGAVPLR